MTELKNYQVQNAKQTKYQPDNMSDRQNAKLTK